MDASPQEILFAGNGEKLVAWRACRAMECLSTDFGPNYFREIDLQTSEVTDIATITGPFLSVRFSPDEKAIYARDVFTRIQAWDTLTAEMKYILPPLESGIYIPFYFDGAFQPNQYAPQARTVLVSPDSQVLISSYPKDMPYYYPGSGSTLFFSARDGSEQGRLESGNCAPGGGMDLAPAGATLATAYNDTVCLWSFPEGDLLDILRTSLEGLVTAVSFSPQGDILAAGSSSGEVIAWETSTWQELWSAPLHTGFESAVFDLAWLENGSQLVSSAYDGTVMINNSLDGSSIRTLTLESGISYDLALDLPANLVLYGNWFSEIDFGSGTPFILGPESGPNLRGMHFISADFSDSGRWLATTHGDGKIYIWGLTGQ